ncbi:MAG: YciI family protein [Candidatus Limnocylindria bacterium]
MRYALLIYTSEDGPPPTDEQMQQIMSAYDAYTEGVRKSGAYEYGDAFNPSSEAVTVRVRDGKTQTSKGPFEKTKETLGGIYVVSARDQQHAIDLAAGIPGAQWGSIEIRPLMELPTG